jgi:hypothetical protein
MLHDKLEVASMLSKARDGAISERNESRALYQSRRG